MADTDNTENGPGARQSGQAEHRATHEEILAGRLPPQVTEQPDPMLQLSVGRVGAGSITLVAIAAAIILGIVLYGLNSPAPNSAAPGNAPAAGGKAGPAAPSGQQTGNTGHS